MSSTHSTYVKAARLGVTKAIRNILEYLGTQLDTAIDTTTALAATVSTLSTRVTNNLQYIDVTISAADIISTASGKLGHANGYPLVAAPGAGVYLEFVSSLLKYDYSTAAYTAGGNITVNAAAGSAITGLISAANSLGASADVVVRFNPLTTAGTVIAANTGINLVAASAFTNPGTAAGTVTIRTYYRTHTI